MHHRSYVVRLRRFNTFARLQQHVQCHDNFRIFDVYSSARLYSNQHQPGARLRVGTVNGVWRVKHLSLALTTSPPNSFDVLN